MSCLLIIVTVQQQYSTLFHPNNRPLQSRSTIKAVKATPLCLLKKELSRHHYDFNNYFPLFN